MYAHWVGIASRFAGRFHTGLGRAGRESGDRRHSHKCEPIPSGGRPFALVPQLWTAP